MYPDSQELHRVLFRSLRSALGLTETEANEHLIRAYADVPASVPDPSRNLCYYYIQTDANTIPLQERSTDSAHAIVHSVLPCRIVLVFYGRECETWAHRCRSWMFLDGEDKPRAILRAAGIYPVPSPQPSSVFYEETGKTWRKRADLVIRARILDYCVYGSVISDEPSSIDVISEPPEVKVHLASVT